MGGCRCIFQNCKVSTVRNPGMHFFHFPLKDKERCTKWMDMAAANEILKLPADKQKNKVICGRHFFDECFMNYKKDRLVPNAIPTLTRISDDLAWSYEEVDSVGKPTLIILDREPKPHLIPPKDFKCPLRFTEEEKLESAMIWKKVDNDLFDDEIEEYDNSILLANALSKSDTALQQQANTRTEQNKRKLINNQNSNALKKPKILSVESISDENNVNIIAEETIMVASSDKSFNEETPQKDIEQNEESLCELNSCKTKHIKRSHVEHPSYVSDFQHAYITAVETIRNAATDSIMEPAVEPKEKVQNEIKPQSMIIKELRAHINKLESNIQIANTKADIANSELEICNKRNQSLDQQVMELKQSIDCLESENAQLKHDIKDQVSKCQKLRKHQERLLDENCQLLLLQNKTQRSESKIHLEKSSKTKSQTQKWEENSAGLTMATPTKAQLFNGIKKYLSASMIALMRMEMFGNADRQWKPDERRAAVDLLNLGEAAFLFFNDEWRLRLPTLREVQEWKRQSNGADDEEDL